MTQADIDHHSAAFAETHLELFRQARAACPALRSSAHGGFFLLTRYDDIRAVLRDHEAFSSGRYRDADGRLSGGVAVPPNGARIGMIEMDPPESTMLRRVLAPWFSVAAIDNLRPRIRELSSWVLEGIAAKGACDVVSDLAKPMPTLLILDILGLPLDRWRGYADVLHQAVAKARGSLAGMRWLLADLKHTIGADEYEEGGVIDALRRSELSGEPMPLDLVCELSMMLLFGGTDTTVAAICHMLRHLGERPLDRSRLMAEPGLIPSFVEEALRFYSPSTCVGRTATRPVEISGVFLAPGDRVICAVVSGNRDEQAFSDADSFDLDRRARPHLAFGAGVHACLGQHLARADLQIFLADILHRLPDFTIDNTSARLYDSIPLVNGYARLPMRFTPLADCRKRNSTPIFTAPRLRPV